MAHFDIHTMKKQASVYLRDKVKSARLALTDVSRIELLAEEATNADPWGPETRTMAMLSDAAFDLEEYDRIVHVLHSRLDPNTKRPWRQLVKTLTVLEYMLTHGPGSLSNEFRADTSNIEDLCQYNLIDQQGIDRGVGIRNKADRVLELLSKADVWKEERSRAQKVSNGIRGFGSTINRVHVATENKGAHHGFSDESNKRLDASETMDGESKSLLSDDTAQESHQNGSRIEWKPFEKCTTIPSYLRHDDGSSPSSDGSISAPVEPSQRQGPALNSNMKSLSSPGHFRTSIWQGFSSDANKEGALGSHICEPEKETGDSFCMLQTSSHDDGGDKEATPSGDVLEMEFPAEPSVHENVVQPQHSSIRQLFGFQKPSAQKNAKEVDSHENLVMPTEPGNASNFLKIPPPPPSRFRRRFKERFQPLNLLDL